ncbi:Rhamnolipids biosynthesis 3-oxoacyl-[acyl-carrier-protein] reductase [Lachnellula occidentalis]|uniref:Rhamnolipids biosynthesis 3-oxoacyl-[acyl-carrier-protein] reductase n=1 Tax=Lachnellula occidentalis TaxID=215460 RepID=A0A8H8UHG4_9HELO|nr:Rhamnolipids biosynthesis 3-oxoacyl-[acyl-carrier-protein] reductase [Lachnellula occidentalis]
MANNLRLSELFDVAGRWVAITGAASGIGHMLARGCAVNGANTILIDVNFEALLSVKSELQNLSPSSKTVVIHGDLSSEDGIKEIVEKVKSTQSSLDALIHCAAVRYMNEVTYVPGDALDKLEAATLSAPYQGWEHTFRLNVLAPYFLTAGLIKLLGASAAKGEGRGCVILFSSPASVHNHQFVPCYQTSKAAVDHLVRIMAAEFADYYSKTQKTFFDPQAYHSTVRVNAMSPGIVPSGMTPSDGKSNLSLAAETPAGRAGNEEDMVGSALWLISKAGAFMDGKVVRMDGGRLLILKGVTSNSD